MKNTLNKVPRHHKLLGGLAAAAAAVAGVHLLSAFTLDRVVQYVELDYASEKLDPALDGYTVAFISDTHAMPAAKLREVAGRVNARGVGLLLLGGDFPRGRSLWRSLSILSGIKAADGIYGVTGNHDRPREYFGAMRVNGMRPLGNEGASIRHNLYLAGTEDLRMGRPSIAKATAGAAPGDFVLLLTHNPDVPVLQDGGAADLALSGHTHGGQITFFGLWSPILTISRRISRYGHRLRTGWARTAGGTDLYVGNGLGNHRGIPRVFARPQVIFLTLRHGNGHTHRRYAICRWKGGNSHGHIVPAYPVGL